MIAQVQPLTTTRRLSGPFDYALPERPVRIGSIVRVPFGRQALDGVVVGLAESTDVAPDRLVVPTGVREDDVPPELVELALWMAGEYCSTPARALALVLPPRGKPRTEVGATSFSAGTSVCSASPTTTPSSAWRPNGTRTIEPTRTGASGSA